MSKCLVLSIKPYDFENNKGERVQGAKVAYINKRATSRENEKGNPPLIVAISNTEMLKEISEVPAIYDLDFEQVTGKANKPELVLSGIEYIHPVDLSSLFE